ncbi:hypothetical protein [Fischerella sp. PCC 9605]|uniref:hypothetical protein n=1 Tax=Fischerella sp. PCC 9605 TaxID=1173024 RepID=UPI0012DF5070|nr:hypothetical protein [Fischerella sp. PCC 9605]
MTLFGKGDETRTVIIPKDLYEELQFLSNDHSPNAAVFVSRKGQKPLGDRHRFNSFCAAKTTTCQII